MHSLPLFVKIAGTPVILVGWGEAAEAKRRLIERAGGILISEDDARAADARFAFVALDDPEAAAACLRAAGKLVNVVDRPDLCDFTTPAIVDRDPVLIAVATGGVSAGLAAALRQRLEDILPAQLGRLAEALHAARAAIRETWADAGARRRAIARALGPGGPIDPLGLDPDVAFWLADLADAPIAQEILVLRLRSADPDDLTLREARALAQADRIVHPSATPAAILARARADAVRIRADTPGALSPMSGLTVRIEITAL